MRLRNWAHLALCDGLSGLDSKCMQFFARIIEVIDGIAKNCDSTETLLSGGAFAVLWVHYRETGLLIYCNRGGIHVVILWSLSDGL